jgi:hypothetical protein
MGVGHIVLFTGLGQLTTPPQVPPVNTYALFTVSAVKVYRPVYEYIEKTPTGAGAQPVPFQ